MTQRITQYNKEAGQPRGGLVNPLLMTVTKLQESEGALDASLENLPASLVGTVVDYLSRLANVCTTDVSEALVNNFRVSLDGARNIAAQSEHISVTADAAAALLELNFTEHSDDIITFDIDDTAVRVACQLVSYDVGKRAGVMFYKPEWRVAPDGSARPDTW